jgi:hypothetical protein
MVLFAIATDITSSARPTHTRLKAFWSLLKRGIMESFHKVSKKYLPLYVAEFQFCYNNRENPGFSVNVASGMIIERASHRTR